MSREVFKRKNKGLTKSLVLVLIVIGLAVVPLLMFKSGEFAGSDSQAEKAVTEINPDYKPWFSPIFEPKSGEVETLIFSVQAALGAGILGYFLGYMRGRRKKEEEDKDDKH